MSTRTSFSSLHPPEKTEWQLELAKQITAVRSRQNVIDLTSSPPAESELEYPDNCQMAGLKSSANADHDDQFRGNEIRQFSDPFNMMTERGPILKPLSNPQHENNNLLSIPDPPGSDVQVMKANPDQSGITNPKFAEGNMSISNKYSTLVPARKRRQLPDHSDIGEQPKAKRPFAPPPKAPRVPKNFDSIAPIDTRISTHGLYDGMDMSQTYTRSELDGLQGLERLFNQLDTMPLGCQERNAHIGRIRNKLHQMELYNFISGAVLRRSKAIEPDHGLSLIINSSPCLALPWDLREDSRALYDKWCNNDLDGDLLRGIDTQRKTRGKKIFTGHKLIRGYKMKPCNVYGGNGLKNGTWWPLQRCAKRDGAHGEVEAGIHGAKDLAAFSVVLSNGEYADRDEGEQIWYCGTPGKDSNPSAGTKCLLKNIEARKPVRVLRSSSLPNTNMFRPEVGIRYDGLYDVKDYEILDAETSMHRFLLERRPEQSPIRYGGVEARPTEEQKAKYYEIRQLYGLGSKAE